MFLHFTVNSQSLALVMLDLDKVVLDSMITLNRQEFRSQLERIHKKAVIPSLLRLSGKNAF